MTFNLPRKSIIPDLFSALKKQMGTEVDIAELRNMLIAKGFSISHSSVAYHASIGNIPGFYKVEVYNKYKWYISLEDATKFVNSFDYFGRKK